MIVGRSAELAQVDRLLDSALGGDGGRLLVVGDPGIGKSALLSTVANRAARRGLLVVRVRAAEGEGDLPYALADDLVRLLPNPSRPPARGTTTPAAELHTRLLGLAGDGPVLLVIDEAQFADAPSVAALAVATERAAQAPVAVLVATRPDAGVTGRLAAWPRLDLGPLGTEASIAVLRTALGPEHAAPALAVIATLLEGNPLALTEAPRMLTRDQIAGRVPLPRTLPLTPVLDRAWGTALATLSEGALRALLDVAVAGPQPVVLAALAEGSGWSDADLDEAIDAGVLRETDQGVPKFVHRRVLDAVVGRSPAARVHDSHRRAAAAAVIQDLPPAVVIEHLVQSVAKVKLRHRELVLVGEEDAAHGGVVGE